MRGLALTFGVVAGMIKSQERSLSSTTSRLGIMRNLNRREALGWARVVRAVCNFTLALVMPVVGLAAQPATDSSSLLPIENKVAHGYATNSGVRIHYAHLGQGPLVVMIHGFPDCWLTWREQMEVLAKDHEVVAIDQRGYNLSDRPKGAENYDMRLLVEDVATVIRARERKHAVVVGHDWGGAVAWSFAMSHPEMTERLVVLNLPHPKGLSRELARNPEQQKNSAYARRFQQEGAHTNLTAEGLTFWIRDPAVRARYREAFGRSDFEAMLNYYKRNYPREPYTEDTAPPRPVTCPVLLIHGLKDKALLPGALNETWRWVEKDLTLVTIPQADHWVQQDAAQHVSKTIARWLQPERQAGS